MVDNTALLAKSIPRSTPVPPLAVCTSLECGNRVVLQNYKESTATPAPFECPDCKATMISTCPNCGFLLLGSLQTDMVMCPVCLRNIRETYQMALNAQMRAKAV